MKDKLMKLLKQKEDKRAALVTKSEKSEDVVELRSIHTELGTLNEEIEELRGMIADAEATESGEGEGEARTNAMNQSQGQEPQGEQRQFKPGLGFKPVPGGGVVTDEERAAQDKTNSEKRGKDLLEGRSVTVASNTIVLPQVASSTINGTFNQVSSLVDAVDRMVLNGGETFSQPYEIDTPDGTYTAEGVAATDTDVSFGYADISKTKITAYSEITNEVKKLPAADYEGVVMNGISRSARKKLAKEILVGTGAAGHLTGILTTAATAINAASDISVAAITNTTLNEIIFNYGGSEDVEDQAVLILNKVDLKAFSQLRTTDGKPFHTIKYSGNGGTIDGIPFIINSAAAAISAAGTATGAYCMAYGSLSNYKLVIFSDLDVQRSTDYKFKEGMIAHRGEVYAGGNVVAYNGFLRVKKAAAV
ncbi:MAG: phage major capsid protein [Anaeromusa sp.]|uniref:phage major capsid protein n=1 Tax=Anaeromusa sp. TaxID=1872520 RepID=UPI002B1F209F|nr:phage major capsid protein [Anaeromusa sp.]MEA4835362.1 phage major capsid protein [Anaeromusa sp.]